MRNSILLLKDNSIRIVEKSLRKDIHKYEDKIEYMLVQVGNENGSFILHKINKFIGNFTKAVISFSPIVLRHSYIIEDELKYEQLPAVVKEIFSIEELLQYLHSLNRMRYCNKISNSNESFEYDLIEFISFDMLLYNDKNIIYESHVHEHLGPLDILNRIKRVYKPITKLNKLLRITNHDWKLVTSMKDNDVIGIPLEYTKSYQFLSGREYDIITSTIKDMYCSSIIYNPNVDTIEEGYEYIDYISEYLLNSGTVRFHDIWTHIINDYLEYIIYLPTIYTNLLTGAEIIDSLKVNNSYDIKTNITITTLCGKKREYQFISNSKDIISLKSFIHYIYKIYRGVI